MGADSQQVQRIYEETVLATLRPKVVINIACAKEKAIVLLADGNVYDFPKNSKPRLVDFPERARGRIKQITAGECHFVAITDHLVWNVYSWSATNSQIPDGLLGRYGKGEDEESIRIPAVVKDIPGRVSRSRD